MANFVVISAIVLVQAILSQSFVSHPINPPPQTPKGGNTDWKVIVGRDRSIHTEGVGNLYKKGNFEVNYDMVHSAGKGRKPYFEGNVVGTYRFKREAEEQYEDQETAEVIRGKRSPQDRGTFGVTVNQNKGFGPQVRTDVNGRLFSTNNGRFNVNGNAYHEFGRGRKPGYGAGLEAQGNLYTSPNGNWKLNAQGSHNIAHGMKPQSYVGVGLTGRFRRSLDNDEPAEAEEYVAAEDIQERLKRSPEGNLAVFVNGAKGQPPKINTDVKGQIFNSKDGKFNVNGIAHHDFGQGSKPNYNGKVVAAGNIYSSKDGGFSFNGNAFHEISKGKKPNYGGNLEAGGTIYSSSNGLFNVQGKAYNDFGKGRKPGYGAELEARGNLYTSPSGTWKVDGFGSQDVAHGRKPQTNFGIGVSGIFKRSLDDIDAEEEKEEIIETIEDHQGRSKRSPQDRGNFGVTLNQNRGSGPQVRTDVNGRLFSTNNGRFNVNGNAYHEFGRGRKPDYGAGVQANGNLYTSRNGNWRVDAQGSHNIAHGMKPQSSVGIGVTGRFRRSLDEIDAEDEEEEIADEVEDHQERSKRSPQDRGNFGVTLNQNKGSGPQIRTDVNGRLFSTNNGRFNVHGNAYHEFGRGRKPDYGAGLQANGNLYTSHNGNWRLDAQGSHNIAHGMKPQSYVGLGLTGRFRRSVDEVDDVEEEQ